MTKTELTQAQRISYEGADGDCLLFSTPSWTRPDSGIVHHITADFNQGIATCNCEQGRMLHKWLDILKGEGELCKHLSICKVLFLHILEQR